MEDLMISLGAIVLYVCILVVAYCLAELDKRMSKRVDAIEKQLGIKDKNGSNGN